MLANWEQLIVPRLPHPHLQGQVMGWAQTCYVYLELVNRPDLEERSLQL